MGRKAKEGKQRKDRFYKLAKETGYRSRASFKLIQLNRKFEFLQKSRVLIDLCAAPGGWLQVAQQSMPVSSVLIGVDLVPIRQIPNVITLQEDITTDRCRQSLKKQLKTWKADTVLHDGAPNMGTSWMQDAYSQNQLTLYALKVATEMLVKGGWFITKVFRSKDYLSLVWIFKKLFRKVHVTKPQASRNESAEIFVVCEGYLAPDRIDPKFLDPTFAFKEVEDPKSETKTNIMMINKQKPKAEGYEDGDASICSKLRASDFIFSKNHLEKLGACHEIIFDDEDIENHKLTTQEVKECCKDIKVLGRADLRLLLNWRKQLQKAAKGAEEENEFKEQSMLDGAPDVEEVEIDNALKEAEKLELEKLQDAKRKKKKVLKERRKIQERINLKMIIEDDEPIIQEDRELFRMSQIRNKIALAKVEDEDDLEFGPDPTIIDDIEPSIYRSTFKKYKKDDELEYDERNDPRKEVDSSDGELEDEEIAFESGSESEEETNEYKIDTETNPLVVDIIPKTEKVKNAVSQWFDKEDFANIDEGHDIDLELLAENLEKGKKAEIEKEKAKSKTKYNSDDEDLEDSVLEKEKAVMRIYNSDDEDSGDDSILEKKKQTSKIKYKSHDEDSMKDSDLDEEKDKTKAIPKKNKEKRRKLDPEGLALGALMIQSKKMRRDIIDNAYNRFATSDENLPAWFVADEEKHYRKELPVTAEMVAEYKARLREINARPIKKVLQAKARKKRRMLKIMEEARKKAETVTDNPGISEKEKAEQLKSIYKKALPKKDNKVTYVVTKKGGGRRGKPQGVKGRYKVVDKRMKKDDRLRKNEVKAQKKQKSRKKMKTKRR